MQREEYLLNRYCNKLGLGGYFFHYRKIEKSLVTFPKGSYLFYPGDAIDSIYFLANGTLRLTTLNENGGTHFITSFTDSGIFGDVEYLLKCPCISEIQAITDVCCIRIPLQINSLILEQDWLFYKHIAMSLAEKLRNSNYASLERNIYPLEQRLAKYILENCDDNFCISDLKTMSDSLYCSYRQLLRLMKEFCNKKYLQKGDIRGYYFIHDLAALHALAIPSNNS